MNFHMCMRMLGRPGARVREANLAAPDPMLTFLATLPAGLLLGCLTSPHTQCNLSPAPPAAGVQKASKGQTWRFSRSARLELPNVRSSRRQALNFSSSCG